MHEHWLYNYRYKYHKQGDDVPLIHGILVDSIFILQFKVVYENYGSLHDVSHDIASSEKSCQCLDKKVQDFSVVKLLFLSSW